jgi:fibronectin-binding autotransporter adhesin
VGDHRNGWTGRARRGVVGLAASVLGVAALAPPALSATINVNCNTTNLQTEIDSAPPGSTLLIKGICIGRFTVDKNLTLRGNPAATLDGNDSGPTLTAPDTRTVHLIALTITGGSSQAGAGIYRPGVGHAVLTLDHVSVVNNVASGATIAAGGGIWSAGGPIRLTSSSVSHNRASVSSSAGAANAAGGGIVTGGPLTLVRSTVSFNRAVASSSADNATATAGGVDKPGGGTVDLVMISSHADGNHATATSSAAAGGKSATAVAAGMSWSGGDLVIKGSTLSANIATASATADANPATSVGGGLIAGFATGTVSGTTLAGNRAIATSSGGAAVAVAGALDTNASVRLTLTRTRLIGSQATADASTAATAVDGGILNSGRLLLRSSVIKASIVRAVTDTGPATAVAGGLNQSEQLTLTRSSIDQNHVTARTGNGDAVAVTGGVSGGDPTAISGSTISRNTVTAVAHGAHTATAANPGLVIGGSSPSTITNSTIVSNLAHAESDATTGAAASVAGGIHSAADSLLVSNTTIARNLVGGSAHTRDFRGGGVVVDAGTTTLRATILALNIGPSTGGPNCHGPLHSQGNNVVGTLAGCTFTHKPSDQLNTNPELGALANNGGPTLTLALLNGSPALDVIPPAGCAVARDQRGVHRPQGPRCDVGSYERKV